MTEPSLHSHWFQVMQLALATTLIPSTWSAAWISAQGHWIPVVEFTLMSGVVVPCFLEGGGLGGAGTNDNIDLCGKLTHNILKVSTLHRT